MPYNAISNELVNELADHLVSGRPNSELWKEMLVEEHSKNIERRIRDITYVGISAGVSEPLAYLVMLKYAESEGGALKPENVAAIVRKEYSALEHMTDQEKKYCGIPVVKKNPQDRIDS